MKVSEVVYACCGCVKILGGARCCRVVDCVPPRRFFTLFIVVHCKKSVVRCSIP